MLRWRRLAKGELDHEWIWLAVSIFTVVGAAGWLRLGMQLPPCAFREGTGLCCVSCGATTCFLALLRGDFPAALAANPAAFFGFAITALFDVYAASVLAFRLPRIRVEGMGVKAARRVRVGVIALIALNWAYLLAR